MLLLSGSLINKPVVSLRTGGKVAFTEAAIFNPNNLKIEGFYCADQFSKNKVILLTQDIRDIIKDGFIVDDHDVLTDPEELIRLKEIMEINFELPGKAVQSESKKRLGKVSDYAVDDQSLYVQKLYVAHSLIKNFSTTQLIVDRNQIIETTNKRIIIKEPLQPTKAPLAAPAI